MSLYISVSVKMCLVWKPKPNFSVSIQEMGNVRKSLAKLISKFSLKVPSKEAEFCSLINIYLFNRSYVKPGF